MKKDHGNAWDYDQVDVGHFLKSEFQVGEVDEIASRQKSHQP
jgi:hypothetical protein